MKKKYCAPEIENIKANVDIITDSIDFGGGEGN